jgi:DNA adenine methylase
MRYPGGKNAAGTFQRLINQIPPHRVYLEGFAGLAAILRLKRPAERSIAVDLDGAALAAIKGAAPAATELVEGNVLNWLVDHLAEIGSDWFCYFDPPYLPETCASPCRYRYGLDEAGHANLLKLIKLLPCPVMISGYASQLYAYALQTWPSIKFPQMTRGGWQAVEWLWMNYPEPVALHDYRYLGEDRRVRWNFTKRRRRWTAKLLRMNVLERRALLAALADADQEATPKLASAASDAENGVMAGRAAGSGVTVPAAVCGVTVPAAVCGVGVPAGDRPPPFPEARPGWASAPGRLSTKSTKGTKGRRLRPRSSAAALGVAGPADPAPPELAVIDRSPPEVASSAGAAHSGVGRGRRQKRRRSTDTDPGDA